MTIISKCNNCGAFVFQKNFEKEQHDFAFSTKGNSGNDQSALVDHREGPCLPVEGGNEPIRNTCPETKAAAAAVQNSQVHVRDQMLQNLQQHYQTLMQQQLNVHQSVSST